MLEDGALSLIGRRRELDRLSDVLDRVTAGHGVVVALSGEAGIGKSRLAEVLLTRAKARGFRVLTGAAGHYEYDLSYAPVLQALRPLVEPEDRSTLGTLLDGLSDLATLFDGLPVSAPRASGDAALERTRLFEAICRLVRRVTEDQPVALFVDDLQWADRSSVDVLRYLALGVTNYPCLVVVTYRSGEGDEFLRQFRTALRRLAELVEIRLVPLDESAVAALASELLGGEPPPPLLELLSTRACGIPLYVSTLLTALIEEGRLHRSGGRWVLAQSSNDAAPATLLDTIAARLDDLRADDRAVLEAVAVCGDRSTLGMLGVVLADTPERMILDSLARLRATGLISEHAISGEVVYRTGHPLIAEVAYAGLSARERQTQHAALARKLAARHPAEVSRLAHHVRLAGAAFDQQQALDILRTAASAALARRAGREAAQHAEAALALVDTAGRADLRYELLECLAQSATLDGDAPRAELAWRAAADATADPVMKSRCLRRLAYLEWQSGMSHEAQDRIDEAMQVLAQVDAPDERLRALWQQVTMRVRQGQGNADDLVALRDQALRAGNVDQAAVVDRYLRSHRDLDGLTVPAGPDEMEIAREEAQDPVEVASWQPPWIIDAISRGDLVAARDRAHHARRIGVSAGSPTLEVAPIALEGLAEWLAGDWDRSMTLAGNALILAHQVASNRGIALALTIRALVLLHRGLVVDARNCVIEARDVYAGGDQHVTGAVDTVDALICLAEGNSSQAIDVAERAGSVTLLSLLTLQTRATTHLAANDLPSARKVAEEIAAIEGPYAAALSARISGLSAALPEESQRLLTEAEKGFGRLAMPFEALTCQLERAELRPSAGSAPALEAALTVFEQLGAVAQADRTRRLLRRLGRRPKPRSQTSTGLSARETEIAQLVAQGLSNHDVAQRLFISTRTVSTHLDHIYRRLQISSRQELTRYVTEQRSTTHSEVRDT